MLRRPDIVDTVETETGIYGLFGKYRPLSNFHTEPMSYRGRTYLCSEAAYMSCKTHDEAEKDNLTTMYGKDAKKYGQTVKLRSDWNSVRVQMMEEVLIEKFEQCPYLMELLKSTGTKYIEETNWWGDMFWGVSGGNGENNLGKILMKIRDRISLGV